MLCSTLLLLMTPVDMQPTRDKEAVAILEKAEKARGGREKIRSSHTRTVTMSTFKENERMVAKLKLVNYIHPNSERHEYYNDDGTLTEVYCIDGEKFWYIRDGVEHDVPEKAVAQMKESILIGTHKSIYPFLEDQSYTITLAPEEKIGTIQCHVVKVSKSKDKSIIIYIDKSTHLPRQLIYCKDGKEYERFECLEFQAKGGIQWLKKAKITTSEGIISTAEILEIEILKERDESLFKRNSKSN